MVHKLFVYGTLREGRALTHDLMGYMMFAVNGNFAFPFIQQAPDFLVDDFSVRGTVLSVDDKQLAAMDKYEGLEKGLYERIKVTVIDQDDNDTEAWAYVAGPALQQQIVVSGDWYNR